MLCVRFVPVEFEAGTGDEDSGEPLLDGCTIPDGTGDEGRTAAFAMTTAVKGISEQTNIYLLGVLHWRCSWVLC